MSYLKVPFFWSFQEKPNEIPSFAGKIPWRTCQHCFSGKNWRGLCLLWIESKSSSFVSADASGLIHQLSIWRKQIFREQIFLLSTEIKTSIKYFKRTCKLEAFVFPYALKRQTRFL